MELQLKKQVKAAADIREGTSSLTLLSSSVCVSFRVSTGSVCLLCAHSDRPRQQTLRHRLDHSQAGRRAGGRQAERSKAERLAEDRQARE